AAATSGCSASASERARQAAAEAPVRERTSFYGRFRHFLDIIDPRTLFVTEVGGCSLFRGPRERSGRGAASRPACCRPFLLPWGPGRRRFTSDFLGARWDWAGGGPAVR
uniref:Uncharacterized protein n=1 Tax=Monodelphis domestica TaxID=13616 RepID=A0A5F8GB01_MONDO